MEKWFIMHPNVSGLFCFCWKYVHLILISHKIPSWKMFCFRYFGSVISQHVAGNADKWTNTSSKSLTRRWPRCYDSCSSNDRSHWFHNPRPIIQLNTSSKLRLQYSKAHPNHNFISSFSAFKSAHLRGIVSSVKYCRCCMRMPQSLQEKIKNWQIPNFLVLTIFISGRTSFNKIIRKIHLGFLTASICCIPNPLSGF